MVDPIHPYFMQRAIELAAKGAGRVAPNPLVGCVIVHDGQIIGEGYHEQFGAAHAEVNAIASVGRKELLENSTLYVTLEPCAHFGKTPPCSDHILENRIPRVVIGCRDPFSEVNGKGIEQLRNAGVDVETSVLSEECRWLNRRFFTFHEKNRPYVILKWAQSADGFMDIDRTSGQLGSFMISSEETQVQVHRWRAEEAAILIGKNTFINDNPSLTVRKAQGRNPVRILLSARDILVEGSQLNSNEAPTLVLTNATEKVVAGVRYLSCGNVHEPHLVLNALFQENILSVLVEGGATVLRSFLKSGLWDEARIISANDSLGAGLIAPFIDIPSAVEEKSGTDIIRSYFNRP